MGARTLFILSLCCFCVSLGLLIGVGCHSGTLSAQSAGERDLQSFCLKYLYDGNFALITTVPAGKKLVITDIFGITITYKILFASEPSEDSIRFVAISHMWSDGTTGITLSLNSGIVFYPGESVYVQSAYPAPREEWITLSGYYIDA